MTIFGWDASHYDGTLTKAILTRAKSEGIAFFTHKLGEALGGEDTTQTTALAAARDAGILVVGGYWFLHGDQDPVAEASACIAMADAHEPWWREFDGWVWQADSESSSTGLPSPTHVKKFSDSLASRTGRTVLVYASRGMYGDRLAGLGHLLWNANYGANPHGGFADVYPGDKSAGWTAYSGQTPAILQFGSNTTIAGLTTCDANAFRGTITDLLTMIGADVATPLTVDDAALVADATVKQLLSTLIGTRPAAEQQDANPSVAWALRGAFVRAGQADNVQLPQVQAALTALTTSLTPDKLAAAFAKVAPSAGAGASAAQIGAVMHEVLLADAQATAAALAAEK